LPNALIHPREVCQHVRGKAAANYRLAACAPQISAVWLLSCFALLWCPPSDGFAAANLGFAIWCFSVSAMAQVTIEPIKNGPYIVTGEVELIDADGNKYPVEKRMALCRCGASTEKPFCDGTHSKIGFKAAEKAVPESKE
jgi:3-phenylpropionate/trans-cinnamate dioxygenase ferredoxin subunit